MTTKTDILTSVGLAAMLCLTGCKLKAEKLVEYFQSRLTIEKKQNNFIISVGFRNSSYMAAKKSLARKNGGADIQNSLPYKDEYNCIIVSSRIDPGSGLDPFSDPLNSFFSEGRSEYSKAVAELRYGKLNSAKIVLTTGDTITAIAYYLDRSMGKSPFTNFTYFYPKRAQGKEISLNNSVAIVKDLAWIRDPIELKIPYVPELLK